MADYPVLDGNGNTIIATATGPATSYPVLDGNGSTVLAAATGPETTYPVLSGSGVTLLSQESDPNAKLSDVLDGLGNTLIKGGGAAPVDPDAAITALDLWALGYGFWWDPTDRSTLFQTTDTSTPAMADDDPVRRMSDKSGLGNHGLAPTTSARGKAQTFSGLPGLKLDGLDDGYSLTSATIGNANMSIFVAFDRLTDAKYVLGASPSGTFFGVTEASASAQNNVSGTISARVNGVAIGTSTRQQLLNACPENTPVVYAFQGISMSAAWATFYMGNFGGYEFGSRLFGAIACPTPTTDKRSVIESWLAGKCGATL